ncbi:MAG: hypothetical protein ABIF88_02975 [archaeon]
MKLEKIIASGILVLPLIGCKSHEYNSEDTGGENVVEEDTEFGLPDYFLGKDWVEDGNVFSIFYPKNGDNILFNQDSRGAFFQIKLETFCELKSAGQSYINYNGAGWKRFRGTVDDNGYSFIVSGKEDIDVPRDYYKVQILEVAAEVDGKIYHDSVNFNLELFSFELNRVYGDDKIK